jgi:hypothetical protein
MQRLQISLIVFAITLPVLLVPGQNSSVDTLERTFRPHVAHGGFLGFQRSSPPQRKAFQINGIEYATWIAGDSLEASPDWTSAQPLPIGFAQLEEVARKELARLVTNDTPWSVTSFQLHSTAGRQSLKWYFLVEMKPFWESGSVETNQNHDSFWIGVDLSGKPGFVGRKVGDHQWAIQR